MNFGELLWWYLGNARDYAAQMLPCMCAGMAVYALALPVRRRRLDRLGLVSPRRRELALLLFVMFAAGLAALTLFPAGFWRRAHWLAALRGERPLFPRWADLHRILQLAPLREIRRAVRGRGSCFWWWPTWSSFCRWDFSPPCWDEGPGGGRRWQRG